MCGHHSQLHLKRERMGESPASYCCCGGKWAGVKQGWNDASLIHTFFLEAEGVEHSEEKTHKKSCYF